jgi:predicted transcriptional regulator
MCVMDLKRIRKDELGLSQGALGQLLGVNQATISRLETGELPIDERTVLAIEALLVRKAAKPATEAGRTQA